jgi:hypothetical protein
MIAKKYVFLFVSSLICEYSQKFIHSENGLEALKNRLSELKTVEFIHLSVSDFSTEELKNKCFNQNILFYIRYFPIFILIPSHTYYNESTPEIHVYNGIPRNNLPYRSRYHVECFMEWIKPIISLSQEDRKRIMILLCLFKYPMTWLKCRGVIKCLPKFILFYNILPYVIPNTAIVTSSQYIQI